MRLIDADELKTAFPRCDNSKPVLVASVRATINHMPTIKPRNGKWIPHHDEVMLFDGMSMGGMACSVCGWKTHNKMHLIFGCPYKYCPNCGSQMKENEHHTMEEFMQGQDMGNPEDGSL